MNNNIKIIDYCYRRAISSRIKFFKYNFHVLAMLKLFNIYINIKKLYIFILNERFKLTIDNK